MKLFNIFRLSSNLVYFGCAVGIITGVNAGENATLKTEKDKVSYSIGMDMGSRFKKQGLEIDPDILAKGFKDSFSEGKTLLTPEESRQALTNFQKQMMSKRQESAKAAGEKNKKEGETFLAENKKKEGIKTLPSGLQYKVIKSGSGKTPADTDNVVAKYRGTLVDGTEFDSSEKHGGEATFPVRGVIPGWTEALKMMKEGDKWQLFIPPNLAYGEHGTGPGGPIGPNATLIFDIELVSVKPPEASPPAGEKPAKPTAKPEKAEKAEKPAKSDKK